MAFVPPLTQEQQDQLRAAEQHVPAGRADAAAMALWSQYQQEQETARLNALNNNVPRLIIQDRAPGVGD